MVEQCGNCRFWFQYEQSKNTVHGCCRCDQRFVAHDKDEWCGKYEGAPVGTFTAQVGDAKVRLFDPQAKFYGRPMYLESTGTTEGDRRVTWQIQDQLLTVEDRLDVNRAA